MNGLDFTKIPQSYPIYVFSEPLFLNKDRYLWRWSLAAKLDAVRCPVNIVKLDRQQPSINVSVCFKSLRSFSARLISPTFLFFPRYRFFLLSLVSFYIDWNLEIDQMCLNFPHIIFCISMSFFPSDKHDNKQLVWFQHVDDGEMAHLFIYFCFIVIMWVLLFCCY